MSTFLDRLLATGLTKLGDIQFQTRPPLIRAAHCRQVMDLAKAGMVICRKYDCYLDGCLIPGDYSHSGIVESQAVGKPGMVIHAIAEGVGRCDILDFIKDADGVALIDYSDYEYPDAVIRARSLIGLPYDFKFSIMDGGKALYCHETSAACLEAGGIKIIPEVRAGREVFTYDCLASHPRAKIVYEAQV